MAVAVAAIFDVHEYGVPDVKTTPAGWVGSLAGVRNDVITIDASGFITEAVAAGNPVGATTKIGILGDNIASTVAAASDTALQTMYRSPRDSTILEFAVVNNSDTLITPTAAMVGDKIGLYRLSAAAPVSPNAYVADINGSTHFEVTDINLARGTVKGRITNTLAL